MSRQVCGNCLCPYGDDEQCACVEKPEMSLLTDDDIWKDDAIMAANSGYGATFDTVRELARAIEAAVITKLAAVSAEPCAWEVETEQQDGTRAKWVSTDRKRHREFCDFGEPRPLYSQEAIAAARVQALEEAAKCMEGPNNNYGAVIRALIGAKE